MQASGLAATGGAREQFAAPDGAPAAPVVVEFVLRRNCSLSPRALMAVFGSAAAVSFAFGALFAALGAWMVLPFAGVELLALVVAFLAYGRHATDGERLRFSGGLLTVEVTEGNCVRVMEMPAREVRLLAEDSRAAGWGRWAGRRLVLAHRASRLEVGRHLDARRRAGVEKDLRAALARARETGAGQ